MGSSNVEKNVLNLPDIYNLDVQLREKINELEWKTKCLEETEKQLSETRRRLYEEKIILDDERRCCRQLETRLKTAMRVIERLETERMDNLAKNVALEINRASTETERRFSIDRAKTANLENMDLKIRIRESEVNCANNKIINDALEASLNELRNNVARFHVAVKSNIGKLEREQCEMKKSFATWMEFGRRVGAILDSSHEIRRRDRMKIRQLEKRVDSLVARETTTNTGNPERPCLVNDTVETANHLHLKMASTLTELRRKLDDNSLEDKLTLLCTELRKTDERLDEDRVERESAEDQGRSIDRRSRAPQRF